MVQHSTFHYNCDLCKYKAVNRECLKNHVRVHHSDLKPFKCDVCEKLFKLKTTLVNHMAQHTGVRRFSCQFCSKTFMSSGNYYAHRKRMHPRELSAMKFEKEEKER